MDPRPAPRRVPGLMGALGRRAWARGRVPIFRKITLYGKPAKSTHGEGAYPVPTLERWSDREAAKAGRGPTLHLAPERPENQPNQTNRFPSPPT